MQGISHMTFIVHDLDKAAHFFKTIFSAVEVYSSGQDTFSVAREKFFLIGELWIAIMEGESLPTKTYNHIAFKIDSTEVDDYLERISSLGLEIKDGRVRVTGEGQSIYFYDHDKHLFELHTGTLEERLNRYRQR
ncbi:FosX/FosE/FosI family fosfomycin resistance thiol transferase [Enterococcus sp. BWM-S5]|uniref:FosX/FosE/FosI family fosfomycin resistance thiol transferase n=1 Tax=Enterococcus larvae TaxID=2794352 RepID=A0ABS4CJS9_9ENTE|nr:FosX/FosE/FosI family fosfomycin resistance hydrolase [Enterococcus larvae]MBP1046730.1 FosX/FosE/FosI family fosfomycin resistance thiol transferase [Enterococcus larvae]